MFQEKKSNLSYKLRREMKKERKEKKKKSKGKEDGEETVDDPEFEESFVSRIIWFTKKKNIFKHKIYI